MAKNELISQFIDLYKDVTRKFSYEKNKQLDGFISSSQAMILAKLIEGGTQNVTSLAGSFCITPGAVTSLSDKLISSGYAKRIRTESDRRVVYLEITDEGREALQAYRKNSLMIAQNILGEITDEDMQHLIRIYKQLLDNITKHQEE